MVTSTIPKYFAHQITTLDHGIHILGREYYFCWDALKYNRIRILDIKMNVAKQFTDNRLWFSSLNFLPSPIFYK